MADQNPMGGRRLVALELPTRHVVIVRKTLAFCLEGVRSDLERPGELPDPRRAYREAKAYERLLWGLERGQIAVPDEPAREAVASIADQADRECNYAAVVAQHNAFHGLLARLTVTEGAKP